MVCIWQDLLTNISQLKAYILHTLQLQVQYPPEDDINVGQNMLPYTPSIYIIVISVNSCVNGN
jgi:hypothetical protein